MADFEFKPVTLSSACGGRIEEKFQEALAECIEALENPQRFVAGAGDIVTARVTVVFDLSVDRDGVKKLSGRAYPTLPKPKGVSETIYTQHGVVLNQPNLNQLDFLSGEKKAPKVVEHPAAQSAE